MYSECNFSNKYIIVWKIKVAIISFPISRKSPINEIQTNLCLLSQSNSCFHFSRRTRYSLYDDFVSRKLKRGKLREEKKTMKKDEFNKNLNSQSACWWAIHHQILVSIYLSFSTDLSINVYESSCVDLEWTSGVCSFGRTQRERLRTEICELTRMKFKSSLNLSLKVSVFPFIFLVLCYSIGFKFWSRIFLSVMFVGNVVVRSDQNWNLLKIVTFSILNMNTT